MPSCARRHYGDAFEPRTDTVLTVELLSRPVRISWSASQWVRYASSRPDEPKNNSRSKGAIGVRNEADHRERVEPRPGAFPSFDLTASMTLKGLRSRCYSSGGTVETIEW
jgi:hypothetical protein